VIIKNLGSISHRFRDMASFLLKNAYFPITSPPNPEFEKGFLALDH